jgi:hypothetical protein
MRRSCAPKPLGRTNCQYVQQYVYQTWVTLTLGAHHHCTGPALFTISTPIGLVVSLSTIPNYVPADVFNPTEYHGLGRLNVGNSLGYLPHVSLVTPVQLVYPLPDELTLLRVGPVNGLTVDIDEIVRPAVLTSTKMPWDRSLSAVTQQADTVTTGTQAGTIWTYTVPTGKKLWVSGGQVRMIRLGAATASSVNTCDITRNNLIVAQVRSYDNVVHQTLDDALEADGMVLNAAEVLAAHYAINDTGGNWLATAWLHGYTFDA